MSPFVWLGVAVAMAVIEVASMGLITAWFVIGAIIAFFVALLGFGEFVQCIVFIVVSVALLVALRPVVVKYRRRGEAAEPTLIGQRAVVSERIDNERMVGRVETSDRMSWAAESSDGLPIEVGETVTVVGQASIKLVVERRAAQ